MAVVIEKIVEDKRNKNSEFVAEAKLTIKNGKICFYIDDVIFHTPVSTEKELDENLGRNHCKIGEKPPKTDYLNKETNYVQKDLIYKGEAFKVKKLPLIHNYHI